MGDGPSHRGMPIEHSTHSYNNILQVSNNNGSQSRSGRSSMEFDRRPYQEHGYGHPRDPSPLNMESLASTLPNYPNAALSFAQQQSLQQNYHQSASQGVMYQMPMAPFAGQTGATSAQYPTSYNAQAYPQHFQHVNQSRPGAPMYPNVITTPQQRGLYGQQFSASPQQMQRPYHPSFVPQGQPMPGPQVGQGYQGAGQYGYMTGQNVQESPYFSHTSSLSFSSGAEAQGHLRPTSGQAVSRQSSASSLGHSVPRGPPPKPRQSGHALWIGNLPPNTTIFDLKDYFSRDATNDIESVFLISKSNCAFANYRTEATCAAAMQRFNDTRFLGARLVCRLRRTTGTASIGTSERPATAQSESAAEEPQVVALEEPEEQPKVETQEPETTQKSESSQMVKEKFFIIKSLTVEDLETSVRNGIWATQSHNETTLNKAFEAAENVYLIFSANKSGEYFGYARMVSQINDESAATIELPPRTSIMQGNETDLPNKILTPATQHAPKGYVIDDSARGTIFWEAESAEEPTAESTTMAEETTQVDLSQGLDTEQSAGESQSFGKPFRIEWVSTDRLPFYRTRGLRNPWNANREVKIARDGTELEPSVGRRLTAMFHRPQMNPAGQQPLSHGYPMQSMQPMMGYHSGAQPQQQYYQGP